MLKTLILSIVVLASSHGYSKNLRWEIERLAQGPGYRLRLHSIAEHSLYCTVYMADRVYPEFISVESGKASDWIYTPGPTKARAKCDRVTRL